MKISDLYFDLAVGKGQRPFILQGIFGIFSVIIIIKGIWDAISAKLENLPDNPFFYGGIMLFIIGNAGGLITLYPFLSQYFKQEKEYLISRRFFVRRKIYYKDIIRWERKKKYLILYTPDTRVRVDAALFNTVWTSLHLWYMEVHHEPFEPKSLKAIDEFATTEFNGVDFTEFLETRTRGGIELSGVEKS